ncbi:hypothetical protein G8759_19325 [Spirosoma aureum]|uniref:Uncharacterized protein n=1 Tax=Spirosoma aureum TaxID=2692134 RepID=A0A6G9AQG0_9BACT|nr:hypothetical protein [Spirosoma aureum]QIP14608.1 hypothetical protein G8759_19325 [Spirosoma aureum]
MFESSESVSEEDFRCLFPVDESKLMHLKCDYQSDYTEGGPGFTCGGNNPKTGGFARQPNQVSDMGELDP